MSSQCKIFRNIEAELGVEIWEKTEIRKHYQNQASVFAFKSHLIYGEPTGISGQQIPSGGLP